MTPAEDTAAALAEEDARRRRIERAMAVYGSDTDVRAFNDEDGVGSSVSTAEVPSRNDP
jgi:hypothetical protein